MSTVSFITTLPRGKFCTAPPTAPCSNTVKRKPAWRQATAAAKPAGPAPTMITSSGAVAPAARACWTRSATRGPMDRPWRRAFLIRPMPPSSPTTNNPGTLDSNWPSVWGITARSRVPNTSSMAPTGHSAAHREWPMQLAAVTRWARPSTSPRMSPSGQALRQDRLPMQVSRLITGCSDAGTDRPLATATWSRSRSRSPRRARTTTKTKKPAITTMSATRLVA